MRPPSMLCNSTLRIATCVSVCALALVTTSCKKRPPAGASPSAAPSASSAPLVQGPRCSEPKAGASFTIGEHSNAAPGEADADDESEKIDDPAQPFAVEVGPGVAFGDGFAVAALSTKSGKTTAVVAVVDADAAKGKIAELGTLHGDPDPPELAANGADLIALVQDSDASGTVFRLVALKPGPEKVEVVLGGEINESREDSRAARIELGAERGVVVWDEWNKQEKHSTIRALTFAKNDVSNLTRPRVLSQPGDDAEAPALARRPGGFWAAWVSRPAQKTTPKPKLPPKPAGKKTSAPAPSGSASNDNAPPNEPVVELGQRQLSLLLLDENGAPQGDPRAVTGKNSHVLVFDSASLADGTALLAWRDDDTSPGAEERTVHIARARPDGSIERALVEDEHVGVGVPSLLVDLAPKDPNAETWLALDSVSDETRLGALGKNGALADTLAPENVVRSADALALAKGRLLLGRRHGLAIDLGVVECRPGVPPPPDAGKE